MQCEQGLLATARSKFSFGSRASLSVLDRVDFNALRLDHHSPGPYAFDLCNRLFFANRSLSVPTVHNVTRCVVCL